jgi:DNA polymerase-3 subunit alpha
MSSRFVHLHTHSHYSLLQALPKIPELVSKAKGYQMPALALTDSGNLYGAIEFYKECLSQNIKPILGVDFYLANRTRHDREARIDNKRSRLVLLAKNHNGYKNLIKLVSLSHLEGFYYKPRIDKGLLEKYKDDLILISPSFSGDIAINLRNGNEEAAEELVRFYRQLFGQDFFLEITHHPEIEGHQKNMGVLAKFANENKIPIVAAHDAYYLEPEDQKARNTLVAIQNEFSERTAIEDGKDFSFISPETAEKYFKDLPDALDNCSAIVERCNLEIPLGKWLFPDYKVEKGKTADEELRELVYGGFKRRNIESTIKIKERLEYELGIIKAKGYAPYFLVVSDLIRFAHENKILTTIRGSVAGSMVTYLAGITNVDPIEYKLPFERFLNPERPSAPDIDMDFADNRRDEVIAYARKKYGEDKVAQIGTFGTMMARGAVRDVARALGFPYEIGDKIARLIPFGAQGFPMTIDRAFNEVPELKKLYETEKEAAAVIDMAKKIEGLARHISVHAAGVVISPVPLLEIVPLQFDPKGEGKIITQYDMYSVDENNAGLLKFDLLGIRNLAILANAVSLTKAIEGIEVDIENVPLDDKETFELLAKGETAGLFQLNGQGMTRYLKELKPTTIHDINAMVALYRPGPMEVIPEYIRRKHNAKLVDYPDPRMKKYLEESYGLIVYQDDLLFSAIELAGYSWLEADKFRKAVGKKIPAEMRAQKEKLMAGIIKNGQTKEFADKLWKLFEPFEAYGFNKAHAASYGKVAYQTAYMKANFPCIYMAAVLTAESGDVEKIAEIIAECKRMDIPVLPPNINESFEDFTVVKKGTLGAERDQIRFGLTTIKNFGAGIAASIIAERKKNGSFKTLEDFLDRVTDRNLNKKSLEALIKTGALDQFGERGQMLANIEDLCQYNKEKHRSAANQESLFGGGAEIVLPALRLREAPAATPSELLLWEKELLGLYISGHPLDKHKERLEKKQTSISKTKNELREGMLGVVEGIVEEAKGIRTKNGAPMYFLRIADYSGNIEVVVFPRVYEQYRSIIAPEKCLAIRGRISGRNGVTSMIAEAIKEI